MTIYRVVQLGSDGVIQTQDYKDVQDLHSLYQQVGIEEDSYTMRLHGQPVFKGLIGPLSDPEKRSIIRYETPTAFAKITEEQFGRQKRGRKGSSSDSDE